ncbi:hypothetical protein JYK14_13735 [Siccirubricoccus sp. KC 17139]|uniref:Uncharacterized protein n=1 Tax=Siccirubricoccus soli TaxID=2899147 RepID=A0ABT1D5L8_9PROT|nr:hypothetical protein [Siccirubricoccus soli]MCO6417217.1 hypothetical protein [Siccirubricoccus soli]MCP2683352.1 hypothetical protein [Siccirubricoccus soli]
MTYLDADLLALAATLLLLGGVPALMAWRRSPWPAPEPKAGPWGLSGSPAPVFREMPRGVTMRDVPLGRDAVCSEGPC